MSAPRPLNAAACRVLDFLTADLADPCGPGKSSRKFDNAPGAFMAACVQRTGDNTYAVAHYFESPCGDLVADPDVEFVKMPGAWFVTAMTVPGRYTVAMRLDADGMPSQWNPYAYADLRSFAQLLLRNIRHQQKLKLPRRAAMESTR